MDDHFCNVYTESGSKKVFAGAINWPGWCRSARDEAGALQALLDYAPRYAQAIAPAGLGFMPPTNTASFAIVERLPGSTSTDFGSPAVAPSADSQPMDGAELARSEAILRACWQAEDEAVETAKGKELRKGPRGGGRELDEIRRHVVEAEAAYINRLGWPYKVDETADFDAVQNRTRETVLHALRAAARGELLTHGPRGGAYWSPRYFVRRTAWHALDHAWEIEDRIS